MYIKCLTQDNTNFLTIEGEPTKEQLAEAWIDILQEVSNLIQTKKSKSIFELWHKIEDNKRRIALIESSLAYLWPVYDYESNSFRPHWDKDIVDIVCNLGYDYIEETDDLETYKRKLKNLENEMGTLIVMNNQYYNEYELLCPESETSTTRDEMDYQKELVILGKYQGGPLDKTKVSLFEIIAIKNTFLEEVDKNKKK